MTQRQDVDAVIQGLQRLHSSLSPAQQRILERTLDSAQATANTQAGTTTPDVMGYMATNQPWNNDRWSRFGEWTQSCFGQERQQQ